MLGHSQKLPCLCGHRVLLSLLICLPAPPPPPPQAFGNQIDEAQRIGASLDSSSSAACRLTTKCHSHT